jgi:hypothetical protein
MDMRSGDLGLGTVFTVSDTVIDQILSTVQAVTELDANKNCSHLADWSWVVYEA